MTDMDDEGEEFSTCRDCYGHGRVIACFNGAACHDGCDLVSEVCTNLVPCACSAPCAVAGQGALFADLTDHLPPVTTYGDEHCLGPCSTCGGAGVLPNPFRPGTVAHILFSSGCTSCGGAGRVLRRVGRMRDA